MANLTVDADELVRYLRSARRLNIAIVSILVVMFCAMTYNVIATAKLVDRSDAYKASYETMRIQDSLDTARDERIRIEQEKRLRVDTLTSSLRELIDEVKK